MITNEQLQKIEVLFEMLEDNIKRLATHLQDIAIACGVDYTDGDFPIDEVLAVIKSTKLSKWGTTKRCGTCAYWKPGMDFGDCTNNQLGWQECDFCSEWEPMQYDWQEDDFCCSVAVGQARRERND